MSRLKYSDTEWPVTVHMCWYLRVEHGQGGDVSPSGRVGLGQVEQDTVAVLQQGSVRERPGELGNLKWAMSWYGEGRCGL